MLRESTFVERRKNTKLRELFEEEAYEIIAPFLDPARTWGGMPMELSACRMLREAFPELSSLEIGQLVSASIRVYKTRNPTGLAPMPAAGTLEVKAGQYARV